MATKNDLAGVEFLLLLIFFALCVGNCISCFRG